MTKYKKGVSAGGAAANGQGANTGQFNALMRADSAGNGSSSNGDWPGLSYEASGQRPKSQGRFDTAKYFALSPAERFLGSAAKPRAGKARTPSWGVHNKEGYGKAYAEWQQGLSPKAELVLSPPHKDDVRLSGDLTDRINRLYLDTGFDRTFFVTDGLRDARAQAAAMYNNYRQPGGGPPYADKKAAGDIKRVYADGLKRGLSKDKIIADMALVIQNQIYNDVYISKHLYSKGMDIKKTASLALRDAIQNNSNVQSVQWEDDHWHVQFK